MAHKSQAGCDNDLIVLPIAALKADPKNPRKISGEALDGLAISLETFGPLDIVFNETTGELVSGHQRVASLRKAGAAEVVRKSGEDIGYIVHPKTAERFPVRFVRWDETKQRMANLVANNPHLQGEFDNQALDQLRALEDEIGFAEMGLAKLAAELQADMPEPDPVEGECDPDEVPEEPATPLSKRGDIWILGEHRLMCGDSTSAEDVGRLMKGGKAEMCFTDPPYGVDYEGGHFHSGDVNIKRKREKLAGDETTDLYSSVVPMIAANTDGPVYTWFADTKPLELFQAVASVGVVSAMIVWHKTNATYAAMNAQYKQRHEPCLYWKPKGSTLRWKGPTDECTIWEIKRDGKNEFHPTQKPVALAVRAIGNHDVQTVLDLFSGSGSTIIACEQTKRRAFAMELEPKYVDVAVARWEKFTGKTAYREDTHAR